MNIVNYREIRKFQREPELPKSTLLRDATIGLLLTAMALGTASSLNTAHAASENMPLYLDAQTALSSDHTETGIEQTFGFADTATYHDLYILVQHDTKQQKDNFLKAEWKDRFGTKRQIDFKSFDRMVKLSGNDGQFFWDNKLQTVVVGTQKKDEMGFPVTFSPNDPNPDTRFTKIFYNPVIQAWDREYVVLDEMQPKYQFNFVIGQFVPN